MPSLRWIPLLVLLAGTSSGCAGARLRTLEARLAETDQQLATLKENHENQALRAESVATGLEKMSERLDLITPPSAQWLKLQKGSAIKWYLDEQAQNVYVQFLEPGPEPGSILVSFSTRARTSQHVMRPGEAVEHRWTAPVPPRSFIITLHRLLTAEDGSMYALFSHLEGPLPGL